MRQWFTLTLSVIFLSTRLSLATGGHLPGELLSETSPANALRPFLDNSLKPREGGLDPRKLISRLLVRQSTCPSGYGLCADNSVCCPLTSHCCVGSGCCRAGSFCYSTGCCYNGEVGCAQRSCCAIGEHCCSDGGCCSSGYYCSQVNGVPGCCPVGKSCDSPSNQCVNSGYSPCPNDSYCCPTGDVCYRDGQGNPRCGSSTTNPTHAPTVATTTAGPTNTVPLPSASSSSTSPLPTAAGPPSFGTNLTVSATDASIVYTGTWTIITTTTCSTNANQCNGTGNAVEYTFTGTAIYLTIAQTSDSGKYSITFEGVTIELDGYSSTPIGCNVTWYRENLSNTAHTVTINTLGVSPHASSVSPGSFEIVNFIVGQQTQVQVPSSAGNSVAASTPSNVDGGDSSLNGSPSRRAPGVRRLVGASALLVLVLAMAG